MNRLRYLFLVGFGIFLLIILIEAPPTGERIADKLLEINLVTNVPNGELVLRLLTKGTRFEDHWQINSPPRKDSLNVYFAKPRLLGEEGRFPELKPLVGNGAYLGKPNIIVLDSDILESIPQKFDLYWNVDNRNSRGVGAEKIRTSVLTWILGHEIGHILCGHSPAHFQKNSIFNESPKASLSYSNELQADSIFAQIMLKHPDESLEVERMLIDLLNFEIKSKIGKVPAGAGILYDYYQLTLVHYSDRESYPEWVLRATRLLLITLDRPGGEGMHYEVKKFAELLVPATNSPPLQNDKVKKSTPSSPKMLAK